MLFLKEKMGIKKLSLSIVFCGEKYIRNYNREFRKKDESTDILSFSCDDDNYLGDLIISIPNVLKNSIRERVPYEEELFRVLIHGFLHLLGYEHKDKNSQMIKLQEKLLEEFLNRDG